jgi:hypothetical protein
MTEKDKAKLVSTEKRKAADQETEPLKDLKKVLIIMQNCRTSNYLSGN